MNTRNIARILGVAVVMTWTLLSTPIAIPSASAASCPDSEVVFARGTNEPPGVGGVGQAFIDSLRSQGPGRSVGVYAVNYPATDDFVRSSLAGAGDARAHVQSMVANCPNTKMVLGGYSQGAGVIDMTTDDLAPQVANHVAAVAVFGNPESTFSRALGAGGFRQSAPYIALKRLTCAFPTIQSAPKAATRPRTSRMFPG
jgi:cutinase